MALGITVIHSVVEDGISDGDYIGKIRAKRVYRFPKEPVLGKKWLSEKLVS